MIDCAGVLMRSSRVRPLIVFAALVCALPARAVEQHPCDQGLRPTIDAWGYRDVGGRCEGTYERLVGLLGSLQIAAVDAGPPPSADGAILRLSWPTEPERSAAVTLRASVLRDRLYFRMDAYADRPPFQWPTAALEHFHVLSSELAVTATAGEATTPLYLPIRFGDGPLTGNYRIVAVPPSELLGEERHH